MTGFTCPTCLSHCESDAIACNDAVGNCPARAIVAAMRLESQQVITPRPNPDIQPRPLSMRERESRLNVPLGSATPIRPAPCECGDPFPCVNPVPVNGTPCDNCGGWLYQSAGTSAAQRQWEAAKNRAGGLTGEPICVKDHKGRRYLALTETDAIVMRDEYLRVEGTLAAFRAHEALMQGRDDDLPDHAPRVRWSQRFITQPAALIAIELAAVGITLWFLGSMLAGRF